MGAFLLNNPKCVFIHIPKTAGSTIRNGIFKGDFVGPYFNDIPEEWEEYFKFAFVRNPYDRMVSAWKMFAHGMENSKWVYNGKLQLKNISFLDFLKIAVDDTIDYHSRSDLLSVLRHHTLPQVHPYHCFNRADFIGKFENLISDFDLIAKKVNLGKYDLIHLNRTKRKHYKEYYDEKTYEIVKTHYKEDLERFNYEF